MKIYLAEYTPCIHTSGFRTFSIHRTVEGAEKAIAFMKMELLNDEDHLYPEDDEYNIKEQELKD